MLFEAQKRYGFDLANTYFIGDMYMDLLTAKNAGCKAIFVVSGLDKPLYKDGIPMPHEPDDIAQNLSDAVEFICQQACFQS